MAIPRVAMGLSLVTFLFLDMPGMPLSQVTVSLVRTQLVLLFTQGDLFQERLASPKCRSNDWTHTMQFPRCIYYILLPPTVSLILTIKRDIVQLNSLIY